MKLTAGERLIALMLCDLLRPPEGREMDPEMIANAINGHHEWALSWHYDAMNDGEEDDTPPEVSQVIEILNMWDTIERSVEDLKPEEVAELTGRDGMWGEVRFRGFDGNNETRQMSIARFLIGDMGRWERFNGRGLNAHMPTMAAHRRMLEVFEPLQSSLAFGGTLLTADQIHSVMRERVHPEHREHSDDGSWRVRPKPER